MRRLTTLAMMLALVGGLAGCGGSSSSSASFASAEHAWEACKGGAALGHEDPACKPLAVKACHAGIAMASNKQAHGGVACEVSEGRYLGSAGQTGESTQQTQTQAPAAQEAGHTPEEEEHKEREEKQRGYENELAKENKVVEEEQSPAGLQATREAGEKNCLASGGTRRECKQ
jgi:hypothetical protein